MIKPKIALVGRPNVGKSALFNTILKQRISIVDSSEGVTRDRLYASSDLFGRPFELIDTGGINPRSNLPLQKAVQQQTETAIDEADSLILVVDGKAGVTPLDEEIARLLKRQKKQVVLAVNKIDNHSDLDLLLSFKMLGIERMCATSALHGFQIAELIEAALLGMAERSETELPEEEETLKVALVGKPNAGKSSLLNALLGEERSIVSPIPGTTRDAIDTLCCVGEKRYTLIDTAGIRKKSGEREVVDLFAAMRTEKAIERADISLLLLDVEAGITVQDKKIAKAIEKSSKGCIILLNKWDLAKGFRMEHSLKALSDDIPFMNHCPKLCISAVSGRYLERILPLVDEVAKEMKKRITTHQLNSFLERTMQQNHPPMIMGKRLRIYYMTQVAVQPPTFVLFVNYPHLMAKSYEKYLFNQFRLEYGFTGCPIIFQLKPKRGKVMENSGE